MKIENVKKLLVKYNDKIVGYLAETILLDNSPIVSKEYLEDAKILNSKISNPSVKNIALVEKVKDE